MSSVLRAEEADSLLELKMGKGRNVGELEEFLFGASEKKRKTKGEKSKKKKSRITVDRAGEKEAEAKKAKPVIAAWADSDDDLVEVQVARNTVLKSSRADARTHNTEKLKGKEYTNRLRKEFQKLRGSADWAEIPKDEDDDDDDDANVLGRSGSLTSRPQFLPRGRIQMEKLVNANKKCPARTVIQNVQFHPTAQLMMAASTKSIDLFQVDGIENDKIQGVRFDDMNISSASFTSDGQEIIVSGDRPHFYVFNVERGRVDKVLPLTHYRDRHIPSILVSPDNKTMAAPVSHGKLILLSRVTKQRIGEFKINEDRIQSAVYSADGKSLYTAAAGGILCEWDIGMRKCVRRLWDPAAVDYSALTTSTDGHWLAAGSKSGIVSIYDLHQIPAAVSATPSLLTLGETTQLVAHKTISNLTTSISKLVFNRNDGQVLAIASQRKERSMKLVHVPSFSVFSNFPTVRNSLQFITSIDFSPKGGMMAVGNAGGRVQLFRLKHYSEI